MNSPIFSNVQCARILKKKRASATVHKAWRASFDVEQLQMLNIVLLGNKACHTNVRAGCKKVI